MPPPQQLSSCFPMQPRQCFCVSITDSPELTAAFHRLSLAIAITLYSQSHYEKLRYRYACVTQLFQHINPQNVTKSIDITQSLRNRYLCIHRVVHFLTALQLLTVQYYELLI